jgi:hypothetical protein
MFVSWAGRPSTSSPVKGGIDNFKSGIMHIGPRHPCDPTNPWTKGSRENIQPGGEGTLRLQHQGFRMPPGMENNNRTSCQVRSGIATYPGVGGRSPNPLECGPGPWSGNAWEYHVVAYSRAYPLSRQGHEETDGEDETTWSLHPTHDSVSGYTATYIKTWVPIRRGKVTG